MLTRLATVAAWAAIAAAVVLATDSAAFASVPAGVGVHCIPGRAYCNAWVVHGGSSGTSTGTGEGRSTSSVSASSCRSPAGDPVACYAPNLGWYSQALHCYFLLASPWPTPGDPRLGRGPYHQPADGGSYFAMHCSGGAPTQPNLGLMWRPTRPPGYGWALSPDVLAARAVKELRLHGPLIVLSPPARFRQIVGLPVWAATRVTSGTWGTHAATAAAGGESVTATAVAQSIGWSWGDGTSTTCTSPGTMWTPADDGNAASPTCGHTYAEASHGVSWTVTASTNWSISWVGGGAASGAHGAMTVVAPAQTHVQVVELQAINSVPERTSG